MGSLAKIFHSPKEVFEKVDEKPNWLLPFLTVIFVSLIVTAVLLPTVLEPAAVEGVQSKYGNSEEVLERAMKWVSGPRFYAMTLAAVLISTPIQMLAQAGILSLFLLLLHGEVKFQKLLAVTSYSALISVLGAIVKGGISLGTKSTEVYTNLSLFLPFVEKDTFLYRLLTRVDFFTIWSLVVFGLGLSIVGRIEKKKSYILIFSLWIALVLAGSLLGGLQATFSGGT